MPSWNDGETSSEDPLPCGEFDGEISSVNPDVPETLHDPDFCGIERHCEESYDHWEKLEKFVAFEGVNTGRRFLGCARREGTCSTVHWVDQEWPDHPKKSLLRIWELYDSECSGRIKDKCEHATAYFNLNQENKGLEDKNKNLQVDLGKAISESQVPGVSQNLLDLQKMLKDQAMKQRDELKEEKKKLEYYIADLLKAAEVNKEKLKKMREILEE